MFHSNLFTLWKNGYFVISSYSVYSAKKVVDLAAGTIGRTPIFISPDPNATSNPLETGLTSDVPDFIMPGATFLLQTGSIEAAYPTFTGAS